MIINILKDTIAAIATPLGIGGVGVIRISGDDSFKIISNIFSSKSNEKILPEFKNGRIYHGWVVKLHSQVNDPSNTDGLSSSITKSHSQFNNLSNTDSLSGSTTKSPSQLNDLSNIDNFILIDEVIVLVFKSPKSYTGEDVIEIHCHGGINIVKNILNLCLDSGARMAEPGEFTKRAFLNGKLDLSKAEAVLDLIHSKTDIFSLVSAHNLAGKLCLYINTIREELLTLLSLITAAIDFPEEVDEPAYDFLENKIKYLIERIDFVLDTSSTSNLMRHGLKIAIAGKPNVGKSSIFNSLLSIERSIVTDIPGTTRDVIQESIDISGIPVTLIDTAGIRELEGIHSGEYIESIGINMTKTYINDSDIVLFVYDLSQGMKEEDISIFEELKDKQIIKIGSKKDLLDYNLSDAEIIPVSSKTQEGFDLIKKSIENLIFSKDISVNSDFSTNIRQQECLKNTKNSLLQALTSTQIKEAQDFIAIDLKDSLLFLGEITGEVVSDEIINNIFSSFCIGK